MRRTWYAMQAATEDPSVVDISIVDYIGSWDDDWYARNFGLDMGVTARAFVEDLAKLPAAVQTLRVHINSPGGDVQGGINIANALRDQQLAKGRTVETHIDGLAASIASVIAMAGSRVYIADNALLMIHDPWIVAVGSARDLRKTADVLDAMTGQAVATYQWHSALSADEILALMQAETWMDAEEAIARGFATDKVVGLKAVASLDPRGLATLTIPEKYRAQAAAFVRPAPPVPAPASAADILALCREHGCLELAEALLAEHATLEAARTQVAAAQQRRLAADARATEIASLCALAKQPELATGYIASAMTLDAVRAHLTIVTAKLDRVEIDTNLDPSTTTRSKARIDIRAIYQARNGHAPAKE